MSISVLLSPAPGWYPDPAGIATYRWWDGDVWTEGTHAGLEIAPELVEPGTPKTGEFTSALVAEFGSTLKPSIKLFADEPAAPAAPSTVTSPPVVPVPEPSSSFADPSFSDPFFADPSFSDHSSPDLSRLDQSFSAEPSYLGPLPDALIVHAPAAEAPASHRTAPIRSTAPAKTRWSSMLFAFPFVYPIVVGMVVALGYAGGAASSTVALIVIAAVAAIGGLVPAWVFADNDRRELVARGYSPAPSIAWMLVLPPIAYLLARRRVVGPAY